MNKRITSPAIITTKTAKKRVMRKHAKNKFSLFASKKLLAQVTFEVHENSSVQNKSTKRVLTNSYARRSDAVKALLSHILLV